MPTAATISQTKRLFTSTNSANVAGFMHADGSTGKLLLKQSPLAVASECDKWLPSLCVTAFV